MQGRVYLCPAGPTKWRPLLHFYHCVHLTHYVCFLLQHHPHCSWDSVTIDLKPSWQPESPYKAFSFCKSFKPIFFSTPARDLNSALDAWTASTHV